MKTYLDCIPCFVRQALEAARILSSDSAVHESIVRDVLSWTAGMDLRQSPPFMGQKLHRRLREITGIQDPYRAAKDRFTRFALGLLPGWAAKMHRAPDPLELAVQLAIAANIIDMGAKTGLSEADLPGMLDTAVSEPLVGDMKSLRQAVEGAKSILYLADNAGEIVFDRLLIEQLSPERVTLAVRGAPVINDATVADARAAGLCEIINVIDNGSDAPGTILGDCSKEFLRHFNAADLILAKGQGNFETLSDQPSNVFFLFKAKCSVIADHVNVPVGAHVLTRSGAPVKP